MPCPFQLNGLFLVTNLLSNLTIQIRIFAVVIFIRLNFFRGQNEEGAFCVEQVRKEYVIMLILFLNKEGRCRE